MNTQNALSNTLFNARIKRGLTQKEAAEQLGISRTYYNLLENSVKKLPSIHLCKKIAEFCGVEIKDIYRRK